MKNIPDFLKDATNVYRTKHYIVKQDLYLNYGDDISTGLLSKDTFYRRNKSIDKLYELIFCDRSNLEGRRIKSSCYERIYIE